MFVFYFLLLIIVHFISDLYYFAHKQYVRLLLALKNYRFIKANSKYASVDSKISFQDPSKLPKHLAIILGYEDVSTGDLLNLVDWCVALRIPCVTFYDHKGNLKKNKSIVERKYNDTKQFAEHIVGLSDSQSDTKIQVLSYTDGKEKIVALTKSLANTLVSKSCVDETITPELLDERLRFNNNIPDPDLAIVFGKTMCSYGFLPWQTRITEFLPIVSHHHISPDKFKEILMEYGKCEQHYGK